MIDMQAARKIIGEMSPLPWIVLEEENGQMTIIRNPNHPIHADGLNAWGRREDAERPDARGIAYMRAEFPAAIDEIDRLIDCLIEERARGEFYLDMVMSLVHDNCLNTDLGDLWRKDEYHEPSYIEESDAMRMARQQLEAEGKI